MCGCTDSDDVVDSFLRDYLQNCIEDKNLKRNALDRYESLEEYIPHGLTCSNQMVFDYLIEAILTYSFGLFRSSIFCCASITDFKLKELAKKYNIMKWKNILIEECTLGRTIGALKENDKDNGLENLLINADWINGVRNRVAIHPTISNIPGLLDSKDYDMSKVAREFLNKRDFNKIKKNLDASASRLSRSTKNSYWLQYLALIAIKITSDIASFNPHDLEF